MIRFFSLLILPLLLVCISSVAAQVPVPPLSSRVTDTVGLLTPDQRRSLETMLAGFEQQKGAQIVFLSIPSTAPETIEQFGIRVAEAWRIGRTKVNDGAILIVAKNDRRMRIEVGYGLEGALTDLVSKRIIEDIVAPQFKAGHFYEGIRAGLDAMIRVVQGEQLPPPQSTRQTGSSTALLFPLIFLLIIFLQVRAAMRSGFSSYRYGRSYRGSGGFGGFSGSSRGGGGFSGGGGSFGGGGASGSW